MRRPIFVALQTALLLPLVVLVRDGSGPQDAAQERLCIDRERREANATLKADEQQIVVYAYSDTTFRVS